MRQHYMTEKRPSAFQTSTGGKALLEKNFSTKENKHR